MSVSVTSSDNNESKIYLHIAKRIINQDAYIYKPDALELINTNHIVRISYELTCDEENMWRHDAPYVKISIITNNEILGEVQNINRIADNRYPLNIGDKIWFKHENIIEIFSESSSFKRMLTKEKVATTGPLYTVQSDSEDDSGSDSENSIEEDDNSNISESE